uniref:Secreted protein n=1 Tax=Panagrellus redivivus TaxID=6233 RepID=A0A7E4VRE5_PANRE
MRSLFSQFILTIFANFAGDFSTPTSNDLRCSNGVITGVPKHVVKAVTQVDDHVTLHLIDNDALRIKVPEIYLTSPKMVRVLHNDEDLGEVLCSAVHRCDYEQGILTVLFEPRCWPIYYWYLIFLILLSVCMCLAAMAKMIYSDFGTNAITPDTSEASTDDDTSHAETVQMPTENTSSQTQQHVQMSAKKDSCKIRDTVQVPQSSRRNFNWKPPRRRNNKKNKKSR